MYDIRGFESMLSLGMRPRDIVVSLMSCARHGAEPMSVAREIEREGSPPSVESVDAILSAKSLGVSPDVGPGATSLDALPNASDHVACLALGLCPRYWSKVGFDRRSISHAAEPAIASSLKIM